jgi:hypothetical protein
MKPNQVAIDKASIVRNKAIFLGLLAFIAALLPTLVFAQWYFPPPTNANAQRNALNTVRSQVNWLQNNTRTASNLVGQQGYGSLRREFDLLRMAYFELTQTLTPQQAERGANGLAELNAGLDIIAGAFANYEDDIAGGRPASFALNSLCRVLRQSSALWLEELNKTASQLRIGWG